MRLSPGTRLGAYEIVAAIGAGGMGEVYKARDTRLDRAVAVKVLSPAIASSPDARQRFEREARTISQLTHPHICAIYDVGHQDAIEYLVLELVDGETLADRLTKGALPIELTLKYAAQIADALDAAHRQGIVHRDLKPANVMITKGGVKLLDFGLAKAVAPVGSPVPSVVTAAHTPLTARGVVAGTVQYMAPEQLEGRPADARGDIYALGAIVYEMATGERLYNNQRRTLGPPALDRLVHVSVAADPDDRWQSARDVQLQLIALTSEPVAGPAGAAPSRGRVVRLLPWVIAALAAAVAVGALVRPRGDLASAPSPVIRFSVPPPAGGAFWDNFENAPIALAPDGSQLAFVATDASRVQKIWLRPVSAIDARPLADTDGATAVFWSPDSRSIAFFAGGKLKRVDLPAGGAVTVCDAPPGSGMSGTWGREGTILFASVGGPAIFRVPATGGTPVADREPDAAQGERRTVFPWFLPDGRRYLYSARLADGGRVMLAESGKPPRQVLSAVSNVQYVEPGYLVYVREGTLVGQRFDAVRGEVVGAPFSIAPSMRYFYSTSAARFATARGAVVYHSFFDQDRLVWIDRTGRERGNIGASGSFLTLRISPDGGRLLVSRAQPQIGTFDLWMSDFERGGEQRLTSEPTSEVNAVWSRDARFVFFAADRDGPPHLFRRDLRTGADTEVLPAGALQSSEDVSPDGKTLAFSERSGGGVHLWTMPVDGPRERSPVSQSRFAEAQLRFSRDGRFIAFTSNESGTNEVYIAAYPPTGEKSVVSTAGGSSPRWSRDGRELFYLSSDRRLIAVPVRTTPALTLGTPTPLFTLPGRRVWKDYDVAADGSRFLAIVTDVLGDEQPLTAVLNAFSTTGR